VKNINRIYVTLSLITTFWRVELPAQITPYQLQQFISANNHFAPAEIRFVPALKEFYGRLNFTPVWIGKENENSLAHLLDILKQSAGRGLNEKDYQFNFIEGIRTNTIRLQSADDSLEAELRFADAAIHFYNDIAYGNTRVALGYNGLNYVPSCYNIPNLLAAHISGNTLHVLADRLSPALPEIKALENKISSFQLAMADHDFREVIIESGKVTGTNKPLVLKLYQLGMIDSVYKNWPDIELKEKVKEAQQQFNLLADGVLRATILQELNVAMAVRLQQLQLSLNYYRWLYCLIQNQSVIVVNIPAAYLKVYRYSNVVLEMRMVVGKKSTPTPTLASRVNEVILYPYWHVPYSIATKELLPILKRYPRYINEGNYQVLNKAGKIMDPYSINWHSFSTKYFPYLIRQSTGCDNSLGLIKLNFYSPFGVYLHDTPNKNSFGLNLRYFSHGCMRMQKPMELGYLILRNNTIAIDSLEQKGCLRNQSPITVPADVQMPVIVWYNPAGIDSTGRVIFYNDVYRKFDWMKNRK